MYSLKSVPRAERKQELQIWSITKFTLDLPSPNFRAIILQNLLYISLFFYQIETVC